MSRDPSRTLRPYGGTLERPKPLLELRAPHPFNATIAVSALQLAGYPDTKFEVATSWVGPPLPGTPPTDGPVSASDVILVDHIELARRVAHGAHEALSRGQIPDLLELSGMPRKPAGS